MKRDWQSLQGIMNELLSNSFKAGASNMESKIKIEKDKYVVWVKDDGRGLSGETLEVVQNNLSQPRRYEIEEYYGHLAGRTVKGSGLNIVGMMIDDYHLKTEEGKGTEITIFIKR